MILTRSLSMFMGFLLGLAVAVDLLVIALDATGIRPIVGADWCLIILTAVVAAFTASTVSAIDDKNPCPSPRGSDEEEKREV